MRDRLAEVGFSGVVPVFPLPTTVFFPGVALPLHVFEPRYRALVKDAAAGEGLIAIATLLPGWETEYEGAPAFHPLATIGRLGPVTQLPDGRSNILLYGMERARLEEEYADRPYRLASARIEPEAAVDESDPEVADLKHRLLVSYAYFLQLVRGADAPITLAGDDVSFEAAVHTLCQNLDVPVLSKLRALEAAGPAQRAPMARAWLTEKLDGVLRERGLPGLMGDGGEQN